MYFPQGAAITGILITCAWLFGSIGIVSGGTEVVTGITGRGLDGKKLSVEESDYRVEHGAGTVIKSSVNVMTAAVVSVSYKQSLPDKGTGGNQTTVKPGSEGVSGAGINKNELNHVFGKAEHNLDDFLKSYKGNQNSAYNAVQKAGQIYVNKNNITELVKDVVNEAFPRVCPPSNKYQDKGVTYPSYTQPAKDKNNESWISNVDSSLSNISDFSVVLSGGCGLLAALSIQSGLVYLPQGAAITGILITCAWLFGAIGIVSGGTEVVSGIAGHGIDGRELSASESNYRVEHGTGTVIKSSMNVMTAAVVSVSYKQSLPDKGAGGNQTTVKPGSEGTSGAGNVKVPKKVTDIANQVKAKNGTPLQGYKGGKVYQNMPNCSGQKLPEGINYKEYDVNPYIKGQDRGLERIVIGNDGSIWYTDNHYETFTKFE